MRAVINESGYKGRVRFCSVFLAMLMVLYAIPSAALASLRNDESVPGVDPLLADSVFELPELRTATDKTFRLENGYFYVAHYNTGIHIKDADGNWQDIDNRLNVSGDEIATGDHRIKFAKKTTGNEAIFTMHSGNGKLTLSLDGAAKKIAGQTVNNSEDESGVGTSLQKMTTLGNISASVKYCDILPATDLEYVLHGTTVKENIIVKERQDKYSYSFTMRLNNMYAEPDDSGGIAVYDSNTHEIEYYIPAPVMWDANNVVSHDVGMDLEDDGSGKYTITITADSNWINAAERAFPVVIDPPVYAGGGSNVLDLNISSSSPSSASTGDTSIRVGNSNKAYWKLTQLPELPDHAYITDASFTMECYTASSAVNGYVAVYDVLTDWDTTLTWNKTISQTAPEGQQSEHFLDFEQICTLYVPGVGYELNDTNGYNWNVTPIVKKWYSGENYGLMFAPATGTSFTGTALFRSNDYSVSSLRPQLSITYIDMKGLEDYWTYTSQDAGFAGVASVNNATGNLVVTIPTLTTPDALMPITPAMVYNFCLDFADYEYPNAQTANTSSFTPRGFKMNLNETLLKKEYVDADGETGYYFVWADGDGTEHYFMPTGESNKYADEDGLMLELEESDQVCTVTDDADTVRTFSSRTKPNGVVSAWYLSKITDRSGNSVIISVDSGYRPTAVKLKPNGKPETEQLRIAYNDAGVPYVVWNPASGEGVVFRYSNSYSGSISASYGGYLRRTIRAHGGTTESQWEAFYDTNVDTGTSVITVDAVAEYTYNHLGLMSRITNTLSQYEIRYNTYATKQVSAVREYSTVNDEIGQKVNFTYGTSSTVIRTSGSDDIFNNSDDLLTTCCFDSSGRTVSCYTTDLDRTMIYGASNSQYVGDENEKAKNSIKMSVLTSQQSPNYLLNGGFVHNGVASLLRWNTTGNVSAVTLEPYPTDNATYAAKLSIGGSVTTSTLSNTVLLKEGEYSLSAIVKSSGISSGVSAYLKAESLSDPANSFTCRLSVNEYSAPDSSTFAGLKLTSAPTGTNQREVFRISVVLTGTPTGTESINVSSLMLSKTTGTAEFDMLQQGHFEQSDTMFYPEDYWDVVDSTKNISMAASGVDAFGTVLCIDAGLDEYEYVQQELIFATDAMKEMYDDGTFDIGSEPMRFTVSGWGKGTCQSYASTSQFGIRVKLNYYSGNNTTQSEYFDFGFDKGITDWQFLSGGFATNPDKGMVESIIVMIMYNDHSGTGYFDGITLVRDDSGSSFYEYDQSGYLSSYTNGKNRSWYQYDERGNLTRVLTSDKTVSEYTYDEDKNDLLVSERHGKYTGSLSAPQISWQSVTTYVYDDYGLPLTVRTADAHNASCATVTTTEYDTGSYSHIFGTVTKVTDSLGNETRYFYDEDNGRQLAVIGPEGDGVCYQYDGMGNLTSVSEAEINSSQTDYTGVSGGTSVTYSYDSTTKRITGITIPVTASSGTTYRFEYDNFGNTSEIGVGTRTLAEYTYNSENGKLNTLTYGNGLSVRYVYDSLDRISEIQYRQNGSSTYTTVYSYSYDSNGSVSSVTDHVSDKVTMYDYDPQGKLMRAYEYDREEYVNISETRVEYDIHSRVHSITHDYGYARGSVESDDFTTYVYSYSESSGNIERVNIGSRGIQGNIDPVYDKLGRVTEKTASFSTGSTGLFWNRHTYDYKSAGGNESVLVSSVTSEIRRSSGTSVVSAKTWNYTYDGNGNITMITDVSGTVQNRYYYDSLGQLTREDNRALGKTYVWTYDKAGNIQSRKTYAFTTGSLGSVQESVTYQYGETQWKDLLTKYGDVNITYDEIGNPSNGGNGALTWEGRRLKSYVNASGQRLTYDYNADGIRVSTEHYDGMSRVTMRTEYVLNGTQITQETMYRDGEEEYTFVYIYDENGSPVAYKFRRASYAEGEYDLYFYEKNLQGDVIGIYDETGTKVVEYIYNAWGEVTTKYLTTQSLTALYQNPFRYRGYYYDSITGFYYVSSRYYDPEIGRWLNADIPETLTADFEDFAQYNLFVCCFNNPVNMTDETGAWPSWATKLVIGVGAVLVGAAVVAATAATGGTAAAFVGAAVAGLKAAAVSGAIGAAVGAGTSAVSYRVSTGSWDGAGKAAIDGAVDGFVSGFMTGGIMAGSSQVISSGFKVAAKVSVNAGNKVSSGIKIGKNVKVLSPDKLYHNSNGGTLLKIGKTFRLDVNSNTMLHAHFHGPFASTHFPIGIIGAGIYGGVRK